MPETEWIKNVTIAVSFIGSPGEFSKQISGMPYNPDECIVRAINFNGLANDGNMYLVWCNITNDYIGSFCGGSLSPHFPQTHIWLTSQVPNILEFKLYTVQIGGNDSVVEVVTGDLAIHLDFIKYKRTSIHA